MVSATYKRRGNADEHIFVVSNLQRTNIAPTTPPFPNEVSLSATSVSYGFNSVTELFSVTVPGLTTTITNKISTINTGGQPVTLNVTVANDPKNAGVDWFIDTPTANCGPTACGTLSNQTAFSVVYTPPTTLPSSPFNMPFIQANSMTDPTEFDRNSFTIQYGQTNIASWEPWHLHWVPSIDNNKLVLSVLRPASCGFWHTVR